jgi:hypothetical protein
MSTQTISQASTTVRQTLVHNRWVIALSPLLVGLALVITVGLAVAGAVHAGIAPAFDHSIVLDAQNQLVIHNGTSPMCASIPNPPQHDCFWPGPERREFSVDYLTPNGVRSLLWFRLPAR